MKLAKDLRFTLPIFSASALIYLAVPQGFTLILVYLALIFLLQLYMPSSYLFQRIGLSAALPIIFAPVYLLGRGIFTDNPILPFDFFIFLFIYILAIILIFKNNQKSNRDISPKLLFGSFSTLIILSTLQLFLRSKSVGHAVAWVSGGDNRNHLVFFDQLVREGHLNLSTFMLQPIGFPSFYSMVFADLNKSVLENNEILIKQLELYAWSWVLIFAILGVTFSATAQIIWAALQNDKLHKTPLSLIVFSSLLPLTALFAGPATLDGFITALSSIIFLVLISNWIIENFNTKATDKRFLLIGFLLLLGTGLSWMFTLPISLGIFVLGIRNVVKNSKLEQKIWVDFVLVTLLLAIALTIHFSNYGQSLIYNAKVALSIGGSINANDPNFYYFLIALVLLLGIFMLNLNRKFARLLIVIGACNLAAIAAFKYFSNLSIFGWNYYSIKLQWIASCALFGIVAIFFASIVLKFDSDAENKSSKNKKIIIFSLLAVILYFGTESLVSTKNVWLKVFRGWENPRSTVMNTVLSYEIDFKNPTLFFRHGYHGDSMLANFWLNAYADPIDPVRGWNYTIDTLGDVQQMCDVNAYYPKVTLITYDSELGDELLRTCPTEEFQIVLEAMP